MSDSTGKPRVMVVDDDAVSCQVVSAILSSQGYEVWAHTEPLGALAAMTRECPDVVVLDVQMPGLGGSLASFLDALARGATHRESFPQARTPRVILHSSRPREELARLARASSALGGIEKGDPRDFLAAFEALLARDTQLV